MADNKRIPELPAIGSAEAMDKIPIHNAATDTTYHIKISDLLPSASVPSDKWDSTTEYLEGAIVSYEDGAYIATNEPDNINKIPSLYPLFWVAVPKQQAAGIKLWAAGLFEGADVSVYKVFGTQLRLARLASLTRPYNSVNFDTELAAGDWVLENETLSTTVSVIGTDVYSGNATPPLLAYVKGQRFELTDVSANTITTVILNINGLGNKQVYNYKGAALTVGQFAGSVVVVYDGTAFRMVGDGGGGGASTDRRNHYIFQSNLFTEDAISYRGLISALSVYLTNQLASVTYEVRLDTSSSWTAQADLTALQTWINANITGTEASGTLYWIKVLATYTGSGVGEAEVRLSYTAS